MGAMMTETTTSSTSLELLDEIRHRPQSAHFAARDLSGLERSRHREPVADQLHEIRMLAEQLDGLLGAAH